jgi:GT2 family glycosyltransferase
MPPSRLTVIIVNWNSGEFLVKTVGSVLSCSSISPSDIVVVDNNSSDESMGLLSVRYPGVIVIANK